MIDLDDAAGAVAAARAAVDAGASRLGLAGQTVAYDVAHAAAVVDVARSALAYGALGPVEGRLAVAFAAEAVADVAARLHGREEAWGLRPGALDGARRLLADARDPVWLATLAGDPGPRHLDADLELVAATFRRFADERIAPIADTIHRDDADVPEDVIGGLAALGAFGLSVPEAYGGAGADPIAVVVATEELSRASLAAGGSLITRPEILVRALRRGGTEEQKGRWLPALAAGELMAAVAVTEPDHGSDVGGLTVAATPDDGDWLVTGTKTWCTFAARADVLMLLARTEPDPGLAHRGLSLFVVAKERADGRGFVLTQPGGGRLEGRPIHTLGYRGLHSYELAFDRWRVPGDALVGGGAGRGRGFYLQMEGFEAGRLQTAARAVGLMEAAYEAALAYAKERRVFGRRLVDHELAAVKLARMAATIQACRQYTYEVARGEDSLGASMAKAYACRAAEWVTREAQQLHGGMGYAEEYPVSRLWVDARVLSIFEGSDETLALRVIARRLAGDRETGKGPPPRRSR